MALVNGGFLHNMDMNKFLKNLLLRNRWSDFKITSQESGFDISGRPDCLIWAVIATGKLPSGRNCYWQAAFTICELAGQVKFFICFHSIRVFIADTGSFWSLRSDTLMDIKLSTEFL